MQKLSYNSAFAKKEECFYSVFVEIDGFLFLELLTAVTDGAVVT